MCPEQSHAHVIDYNRKTTGIREQGCVPPNSTVLPTMISPRFTVSLATTHLEPRDDIHAVSCEKRYVGCECDAGAGGRGTRDAIQGTGIGADAVRARDGVQGDGERLGARLVLVCKKGGNTNGRSRIN